MAGRLARILPLLALVASAPPVADTGRNAPAKALAWDAAQAGNPLLPGYYADPSIVRDKGEWFIFATIDPWGGDHLGLWRSRDGRNWSYSEPAWPTKAAATSPTSGDAMVWAPSVVQGADGKWWMYVSVGSEIWVGSAPSPAGPWHGTNGGKPLIPGNYAPKYHMIDAEAFVDDDGQAYLAWGSGLHWVNGHCFIARLASDMVHLDGPVHDVTPAHYFEAPFLFKAGGRYYLTYSAGNTTKDTYQVRYAIGDSPLGPFKEAPNSPILTTDHARSIISPGHHALFRSDGQTYILYHRQSLPWPNAKDATLRQIAVDRLDIDGDALLRVVHPTHRGASVRGWASARDRGLPWTAIGAGADSLHGPARANDDNYATLWLPGAKTGPRSLTADLGRQTFVKTISIRPEYPGHAFAFALSGSRDGRTWQSLQPMTARSGSPIDISIERKARFLRIEVPEGQPDGIWEWVTH